MSSKTDSFVKLAIVFFISLLSFSVGTFVGKKYSDNQHQLAALEPQKTISQGERAVASVVEQEEKTGAMTDEEIAKLAEEFVTDDETPVAAVNQEATAATAQAATEATHNPIAEAKTTDTKTETAKPTVSKGDKGTPVTKNEEPLTAAKNIVAGKTPAQEATTETAKTVTKNDGRLPSSLPKNVAQYAVGKFTVQVASYTDEAEAQKLASDLKNKGYSAFYVPANVKGKTYYRVSVGQFATQKEAQTYRTDLLTKSKLDSAIVQKITE